LNNMMKSMVVWLVVGIVLMTVFNQLGSRQAPQSVIDYSQFLDEVKQGHITKVVIQGRTLEATTLDNKTVTVFSPPIPGWSAI
jgi:cell division protease FtsH